jgi:hypothetical protein
MERLMLRGGRAAGLLGLLLIGFAVLVRLAGYYTIGGFQAVTLLVAGMGAVMVGCFGLLWAMTAKS